jgi:hypothetical protein
MVMCVFGSAITAVSWFGVNLLGTGLHSYGFTERGLLSFTLFVGCETLLTLLGWAWPPHLWRSAAALGAQPPPEPPAAPLSPRPAAS